jgi:hypothetical protein
MRTTKHACKSKSLQLHVIICILSFSFDVSMIASWSPCRDSGASRTCLDMLASENKFETLFLIMWA